MQDISPLDIQPRPGEFPERVEVPVQGTVHRDWPVRAFEWKASMLCHWPLYFEDMPLERYGHSLGIFQPVWSTGQFYVQFFLLPYEMGLEPPWEPIYSLGYYRPGDPVRRLCYPFPLSVEGGILEGAAWPVVFVIFP